ncbi:hypothetical protein [Spirosoma aerolatum]|uniref:hypothetical protein n=1 Tax=Spirosoma aerolatum TaxID=1211326 RepID=UPI0009ADBC2D|nr:hypothetical protein [Spirosoma aerolatum]
MNSAKVAIFESRKAESFVRYGLVAITFFLLLYSASTQQAKGDEGGAYLPAFEQAFTLWPALDLSPYWSISSFYLWVIAALQAVVGPLVSGKILLVGRLLSLACWLILVWLHARSSRYKSLVVLFNPYVLIYSVRAHPLLPGIFLFYLFWTLVRQHKKAGLLILPFAVSFQVFIGGAVGLFMPKVPLQKDEVIRIVVIGLLALSGVLITWLTWGGMYPPKFASHVFFQEYHVHGKPSFGYLGTVFMMAGGVFWFIGNRTLAEIKQHRTYSLVVIGLLILAGAFLYKTATIVGIARQLSQSYLANDQLGWVLIFVLIGLGWLRLHRDHYPVFFGLLGASVLLVTLPYLYERISVFATIAPCLAWCSLQSSEKQQKGLVLTMCCVFVLLFIAYQRYGSL